MFWTPAFAGVTTQETFYETIDLEKLKKFLETKMVRERLKDLGFAPEEVRMKLADLDDRQVHQLALHLDEMQVAEDGGEVVAIVFSRRSWWSSSSAPWAIKSSSSSLGTGKRVSLRGGNGHLWRRVSTSNGILPTSATCAAAIATRIGLPGETTWIGRG
jgi:hypothetical protein